MKLTFENKYGNSSDDIKQNIIIETDNWEVSVESVMEELIIPLFGALGFSDDKIKDYFEE